MAKSCPFPWLGSTRITQVWVWLAKSGWLGDFFNVLFPAKLMNVAGEGQEHGSSFITTYTHPPGSVGAAQTPPLLMAMMNLLLHPGVSPK